MDTDILQNELLIIQHHLDDIDKGLEEQDINYVKKGVDDIRESVARLSKYISPKQASELDRISTESFNKKLDEALSNI